MPISVFSDHVFYILQNPVQESFHPMLQFHMIVLLMPMDVIVRVPKLMYHVLKGFNFMVQAKFNVDNALVFQKMEFGIIQLKNLDAYQIIRVSVLATGID